MRNSLCRRARPALRTARFINSHKKAVAAYCPLLRLRLSALPAGGGGVGSRRRGILGVKRHNARSVQQSYTHSGHCVALRSSLRRQTAAALRGLLRLGLPPPVAMSLARRYLPPQCVSHTQNPPHKQKADSSWIAGAIGACCVSARTARRVSASVAMAAANGVRPAASVRLFRVRLDRGHTTCLHLAAWVDLLAHATRLPPWLSPTASAAPRRLALVRWRISWQRPLSASAAVRAVQLLPAANAFRPTHRLPLYQGLPFSAGVTAAPPSGLAAMAAANGIQSRRRLRFSHP